MSASSETELCNLALTRIGHDQIVNLADDSTKAGDLCRLHYPRIRDAVLRMHPWNFAIKRAALVSSVPDAPSYEYTYAFALPVDLLKIVRTSWEATGYSSIDSNAIEFWGALNLPYRIEGRFLMCNEASVSIEYIAKIEDTTQFDAMFTDVLAARLAAEISMALTDNKGWTDAAWQLYSTKLSEARTIDAQEGSSRDVVDTTPWLIARR